MTWAWAACALAILKVQQIRERKTVLFCQEWSSREANWRVNPPYFFFFFYWALKEKLVVVLKKKYFQNFTNDTKYDIMLSPRMQSCGFGHSNHVSTINRVIWLVAVVCLKERREKTNNMVAWQSCEGGFFFVQNWFLQCYFKACKHMKESVMSVSSLVGAFDDIVRSTSVLAEGIEGGLWSNNSSLVVWFVSR